jgi:hypothetical protein
MAETQHFFSWLVNGLASYVQRQVSMRGRTDRWRYTMLFLGKINGGDMTLLHLAGQWWEGTLATCLV